MQKDQPITVNLNPELVDRADKERDFMEGLLCKYEDIDNKNNFIEKIIEGDLSFYKDTYVESVLSSLHAEIINCILGGDRGHSNLELLQMAREAINSDEDESKYDFLRFFFVQQQRSPIVHETHARNLEPTRH